MMKLVHRTPWQLADEVQRNRRNMARSLARPALDIVEHEDKFEIRVNLPGLAAEDVNVEVEDRVLTISGEIADAIDEETERYTHRERYHGAFKRSLRLGDQVDVENIEASFENGVLTLALSIMPEAQPKQIAVQSA